MSIASYRWKAIQKGFTTIHTSTTNLSQTVTNGEGQVEHLVEFIVRCF